MLSEGLENAIADLIPVEFEIGSDNLKFEIGSAAIENPSVPSGTVLVKDPKIYPSECRQRGATYKGRLSVGVKWFLNGKEQQPFVKDLGEIPIMIRVGKMECFGFWFISYNFSPTNVIWIRCLLKNW